MSDDDHGGDGSGDRPLFFHLMTYVEDCEHDVVDMVSGNPDWEPPDALREGLRDYADRDPDAFQYPPSVGQADLRAEIASRRGVDVERVVVTNGAGEANYLAMACAVDRLGSEVVVADPVYPYYADRTELLGADLVTVPADRDGQLDPDAVAERVGPDTACIVVNSPNNPTGAVYGGDAKRALVDLAEDHDALLVSDEVYDHFDYSGRFESALAVDSDHRCVTNAFSKSMAITGWRVGYLVAPEWLVEPARTRHMLTNVATTRPGQTAVHRALRETPPEYYAETRAMLAARIDAFCDALDAAGAEYTRPQGSFYVMARFEGFPGTLENTKRLVDEAGVAGMPGSQFGESRTEWLRFALTTDRADVAADRLADYFG
jgi:aspartate/methionine/tyrosine aminotransferase